MIKDELKKFPPGAIGKEISMRFRSVGNKGRNLRLLFYFEENEWMPIRSIESRLRKRNLTFKDWYDYHYLPRDENSEYIYPKCRYCGNPCRWNSKIKCGYMDHCENCRSKNRSEKNSIGAKARLDKYGPINTSLEVFISRYGVDEGTRRYNNWRDKISRSRRKDCLIEDYGEIEGSLKYSNIIQSVKFSKSLSGYIDKYGETEGRIRYDEKCRHSSRMRTDPEYCKSIHGTDEKFQRLYNASIGNLSEVHKYSKISKKLFDDLVDRLDLFLGDLSEDVYYGPREWKIPNTKVYGDVKRMRVPDFFIKSKNTIIEFDGDHWHPRPENSTLDNLLNDRTWESVESDYYKLKSYRNMGYYVFVVKEWNYHKYPELVTEDCIKFITNPYFREEYTNLLDLILL